MNDKINAQHLIEALIQKQGMGRNQANAFVKEFFSLIIESLEKERYLKIKGLGTFRLIEVDSRESVNINTGERFELQGHTKISFTPDNSLKELVNKPFAHFESVVLNDGVTFDDMPDEDENQPGESPIVIEPIETDNTTSPKEKSVEIKETTEAPQPPVEQIQETTTEPPIEEEKTATDKEEERVEEDNPSIAPINTDAPTDEVKTASKGMKYFTAALISIALICIAIVAYLYYPVMQENTSDKVADENKIYLAAENNQITDEKEEISDSIPTTAPVIATPPTTIPETPKVAATQTVPKKTTATPVIPDSVNFAIIGTQGTHTIAEGETLTRVALKYYGTKNLWPYLVKHNPNIIKNPNHVPYGTTIKIPKLEKKQ